MISRLRRALCLFVPGGALLGVAATRAAMPEVGQPAPEFALPDQQGKVRRLSQWRGKWLVLYFYPKDDTPGCTTEACNFRDDWLHLQALGAEVVGVSVDTSASHAAFAQKYKLQQRACQGMKVAENCRFRSWPTRKAKQPSATALFLIGNFSSLPSARLL